MENQITYEEFQNALKIINKFQVQWEKHFEELERLKKIPSRFVGITKETPLRNTACSARLLNTIHAYIDIGIAFKDLKVGHLSLISIRGIARSRQMGKKTLAELKEFCFYVGIPLLP